MKKLLFICSQNKLRSPTAEQVFCQYDNVEVRSAGLNNDAVYHVSGEDILWADYIFLMENNHRDRLLKNFRKYIKSQRIVVLGIPDEYDYMDPALIALLKQKVTPFIK